MQFSVACSRLSVSAGERKLKTENGHLRTPYVGRLAPSPTGLLHLGHARTFWIAHQRARAAGGVLWLREDDLDAARVRPQYASAMREDLHWLGLDWDGDVRQSDRLPLYRAALQRLLAAGLAYACRCSRKDLSDSIGAPQEGVDEEPVYNNRCRPPEDAPVVYEAQTNYRFRIADATPVSFVDACAGPQSFTPGTDFGDFLIWRKDGMPSYQLACVVDDAALGMTEVVRGRDLLQSTARQILLQRALGLPTPAYFHSSLVRDDQGVRLAKRHDSLSLRTLRERGTIPRDLATGFSSSREEESPEVV